MKKVSLFFAALLCATTMSAITFDPQGGTHVTAPADNETLWEEFKVDYKAYTASDASDQKINCSTTTWTISTFLARTTAKNIDALTNAKSPCKWLGDYLVFRYPEYFIETLAEVYWRHEVHGFFHCTDSNDPTSCGFRTNYTKQDWSVYGQPESWTPYYLFLHTPTLEGKAFAGWYTDAACTAGNEVTIDQLASLDGSTLYAKWEGSIAISSITLDKASATIAAGQTETIIATVSPAVVDEVFTVQSSDENIATVTVDGNNITVKAIQGGTATISAVYKAGKVDCAITVTEAFAINLHEGTLDVPADQDALLAEFVEDFHAYTNSDRTGAFSNVVYGRGEQLKAMLLDATSGWKWLGDYVIAKTSTLEAPLTAESAEGLWRYTVDGFFGCKVLGAHYNQIGGWDVAGLIGVWRPYYVLAQTPVREGYTFTGWFVDEAHTVKAEAATLPAEGTLHAGWESKTATALENAAIEANVTKVIENGQLVIIRNGVRYNALGAIVK